MRIGRLLIAVTLVVTGGCTAQVPPASESPSIWAQLAAHPLNLTSLGPGLTCPKSSTAQLSPYTGPLAGPGPVYAAGNTAFYTRADDGTLRAKVAWIARPEYTGPALIRGKRLDATGDVRFAPGGAPIASELRFDYDTGVRAAGSNEGWRFLPSTVVIGTTGCYGFQIDGFDWTVTIVMDTTANP